MLENHCMVIILGACNFYCVFLVIRLTRMYYCQCCVTINVIINFIIYHINCILCTYSWARLCPRRAHGLICTLWTCYQHVKMINTRKLPLLAEEKNQQFMNLLYKNKESVPKWPRNSLHAHKLLIIFLSTHWEFDFKFCLFKLNLDRNHSFPINLAPNGFPFIISIAIKNLRTYI